MRGNRCDNDPFPHILKGRKPKVLAWSHIAQIIRSVHPGSSPAYCGSDMVIAWRDICYQGPKDIERRVVAPLLLQFDVFLNLMERDMAWPFNHGLDIRIKRALLQYPQSFQFR